ncbi:hypothetical protein [Cellulomonas edaphi]|uniref:Uncharacterized protein n=1 Tax=Cellulomonas edaphi TaxID=3053468 RepID=A0ABT7S4S9_9CELL|nr:hypothetical protein [Cellulomons edaphi]MDM7830618.1 hypothetical protein [Cellulomons edaphi]
MSTDDDLRADNEARRLRTLLGAPEHAPREPLSTADEALLARILATPVAVPAEPARRPWAARGPARIAVAAAVVLGLVVAGISWQSRGTGAQAGPPPVLEFSAGTVDDALADTLPSARDTLTAISGAAAAQPATGGSGVQRIQSYAWYLNFDAARQDAELATTFTDLRISPDGSVVSREVRAPALDLHGDVIDPDRYPLGGAASVDRLPAGTMDADYAAQLPRDPVALRDAFLATDPQCRASTDDEERCLYYAITDLYGRAVVPADLSATVWAMLADEPAARTLGTTRDRVGRTGEAVVMHGPDATDALRLLVIDPATGQLLSWELVGTGLPGTVFDEPTVTSFQAITSAQWVPER